jgi:hypothetical protein
VASWRDFEAADPELAAIGRSRLEDPGLVLVGTLRKDGWPRISPVEPVIEDQLYLGMMPRSLKALDLLRDPRCVVHSVQTDREAAGGDFKVYGRALDLQDPDERERYAQALFERIDWRPEGDYHLFALDITQIGFVTFEGEKRTRTWRPRG